MNVADYAVLVYEEGGGDRQHVVHFGHMIIAVLQDRELDIKLPREGLHGWRVTLGCDPKNLVRGSVFVCVRVVLYYYRYLCPAWRAPRRPEVNHHRATL